MKAFLINNRLLFLLIILLSSCQNNSGRTEIKWDRDTCEQCRMVISDKHFATQIRGGPDRKIHLFDDMGCAIHWLKQQPWGADETTSIWVTDYRTGQWLEARHAYYVGGQLTPMNFGFGAVAEPIAGSINFAAVQEQLLAKPHSPHH